MGLGRLRSAPRPGAGGAVARSAASNRRASTLDDRVPPRAAAQCRRAARRRLARARTAVGRRRARRAAARAAARRAQQRAPGPRGARAARSADTWCPTRCRRRVVLSSPDWHEGVVGIVAARVAEKINRPAILLTEDGRRRQGLGAQHPRVRPARRRRGRAPGRCSGSADIAPPAACACGATTSPRSARPSSATPRRRSPKPTCAASRSSTPSSAATISRCRPPTSSPCSSRTAAATRGCRCCCTAPASAGRGSRAAASICSATSSSTASRTAAIRFGFNARDTLSETARYDVPAVLTRNSFNGVVRAQLQLRGGQSVARRDDDLCPTACDARVSATGVAGAGLLAAAPDDSSCRPRAGGAAAARRCAARVASSITGGGRSSRPSRGWRAPAGGCWCWSPTSAAGARCSRATSTCRRSSTRASVRQRRLRGGPSRPGARDAGAAGRRRPGARRRRATGRRARPRPPATELVMTSFVTAALHPSLVAAFDRVAFVDPPFDEGLYHAVLGGCWRRTPRSMSCGETMRYTSPRRWPPPTTTSRPPAGASIAILAEPARPTATVLGEALLVTDSRARQAAGPRGGAAGPRRDRSADRRMEATRRYG